MTPTNRRSLILLGAATIGGMGMGGTSTCSSTTLDPTVIANGIKTACGIAIAADVVLTIINAAAGMSANAIISLVCSSYKNALSAQALAGKKEGAATGETSFVVHICDATGATCKDIPVIAAKAQ